MVNKHPYSYQIKEKNKRAIIYQKEDGNYVVMFKRLLDKNEDKEQPGYISIVERNISTVISLLSLSGIVALNLLTSKIISEIYKDENGANEIENIVKNQTCRTSSLLFKSNDMVYVVELEQPWENWTGTIKKYEGNDKYSVYKSNGDIKIIHQKLLTKID
jgi:hypothetical protein